jgi:DNA-binding winged helix-turn-helix (wHTH) protein
MHAASEAPVGIAFGRFTLLPHRRELLADGRPVKPGGHAFDVLMALIEARGAVLSKGALIARMARPDRRGEKSAVADFGVARAFGADRNLIRTVSGRGYQFTAEIETVNGSPEGDVATGMPHAALEARKADSDHKLPASLPPTNLPEPMSELMGRDEEVGEILNLAAAHRLVTLTGAGGIGKTRLALAATRRLLPQFADVCGWPSFRRSPILTSCLPLSPRRSGSILAGQSRRSASRRLSPAGGRCCC